MSVTSNAKAEGLMFFARSDSSVYIFELISELWLDVSFSTELQ